MAIRSCRSLVSLPDTPGIRPVTGHPCARQQRGHWFVEEEVVLQGQVGGGGGKEVEEEDYGEEELV